MSDAMDIDRLRSNLPEGDVYGSFRIEEDELSDLDDYQVSDDGGDEQAKPAHTDPVIEQGIREVQKANPGLPIDRSQTQVTDKQPSVKYRESERIYKMAPKVVTEHYSGTDIHPCTKPYLNTSKCGMGIPYYSDDGQVAGINFFGGLHKDAMAGNVQMKFNPDTQYPSVSIIINRGPRSPKVECRIFASATSKISLGSSKNLIHGDWLWKGDAYLDEAFKNDKLMHFIATFAGGHGPVFHGISTEELEVLSQKPSKELSLEDNALVALHLSTTVSLIREKRDNAAKELEDFVDYFDTLAKFTSDMGDFWFYSMQAGTQDLSVRHIVLEGDAGKPPRWIVKTRYTIYSIDGNPVEEAPRTWQPYKIPSVWPDAATAIAAHKLYLARTIPAQTLEIQACLDSQIGKIESKWAPDTMSRGYYAIKISCNFTANAGKTSNKEAMIPPIGTSVEIEWQKSDYTWSPNKYKGITVPDILNTGALMTCWVFGEQDSELEKDNDSPILVKIKLLEDSNSFNRQMNALTKLAEEAKAKDVNTRLGPDWMHHFLGTEPKGGDNTPWGNRVVTDEFRKAVMNAVTIMGCNVSQRNFITKFLDDVLDGISICQGPPGTGKSYMLACLVAALVDCQKGSEGERYQILVTAASNNAVDAIARSTISLDPELKKRIAVRFLSAAQDQQARSRRAAAKGQGEDTAMTDTNPDAEEFDDAERCFFEMCDRTTKSRDNKDEFAKYGFQSQFMAFVKRIAQKGSVNGHDHVLRREASEFYRAVISLAKKGEDKEAHRATKERLRPMLEQAFFAEVDIVFVTLNTAAHEKLEEYFHPNLLVIDEAGMASLHDMLCAVMANWQSLEHCVMAGDHQQQRPLILNPAQNEFSGLQGTSFLEAVANTDNQGGAKSTLDTTMLTMQYRSHPELAKVYSDIWYQGRLTNHASTIETKGQGLMAQECFKSLFGAAYGNWNFFAVSVDGLGTNSQKYRNTTSLENPAEAKYVTLMAKALVEHQSQNPRAIKIQNKDIMVLSPYSGQVRALFKSFWDERMVTDKDNRVQVKTVATVQGEEEYIVFVSFAANRLNDPAAIKFAVESHTLDVAISRAKCTVVLVGNFLPWMKLHKQNRFAYNRSFLKPMEGVLKALCPEDGPCKIISFGDLQNALDRNTPAGLAEFPLLIEGIRPVAPEGQGKGNKRKEVDLRPTEYAIVTKPNKKRGEKPAKKAKPAALQTLIDEEKRVFKPRLEAIPIEAFNLQCYSSFMGEVQAEKTRDPDVWMAIEGMAQERYRMHQAASQMPAGHFIRR